MNTPTEPPQDADTRRRLVERWQRDKRFLEAQHERDLAVWRLQRIQARRSWRAIQAIAEARESSAALLRLPITLLRILLSRVSLPPKPAAPQYPAHPFGVETSPAPLIEAGRRAAQRGQHRDAREQAEQALAIDPDDVRALDLYWRTLEELGEISAAIRALRRQRQVLDRSWLRLAERRLNGWFVATDPRWAPPAPALDASGPGVILSLASALDESGRQVIAIPGHPDIAPSYDHVSMPLDTAAEDLAWFAAQQSHGQPVRVVVAPLRLDDLVPALAALGISRANRVRLALVITSSTDGFPSESEAAERLATQHRRLIEAADLVVEDPAQLATLLQES